jgi:hypothetical protein
MSAGRVIGPDPQLTVLAPDDAFETFVLVPPHEVAR